MTTIAVPLNLIKDLHEALEGQPRGRLYLAAEAVTALGPMNPPWEPSPEQIAEYLRLRQHPSWVDPDQAERAARINLKAARRALEAS